MPRSKKNRSHTKAVSIRAPPPSKTKAKKKKKKKNKKKKKPAVARGSQSPAPNGEYVAYGRDGRRVVMSGATASRRNPLYCEPGMNGVPMNPVQYARYAAHNLGDFIASTKIKKMASEESVSDEESS